MSQGLSLEVHIPPSVEASAVISVGARYNNMGHAVSTVAEALQSAFTDPGGIAELCKMGVQWHVEITGGNS